MLQCVATILPDAPGAGVDAFSCSVLQRVAVRCSALQCVAVMTHQHVQMETSPHDDG